MKGKIIRRAVLSLAMVGSSFCLHAGLIPKRNLLEEIKQETKRCVVQIISRPNHGGNGTVRGHQSTCEGLNIISPSEANIFIDGEWLTAKISESALADGGDLDDLVVTNARGQVLATKINVAAYGSVLVAMAGDSDFSNKQYFDGE